MFEESKHVNVLQDGTDIYFGVSGSIMKYYDLERIIFDFPHLKSFVMQNKYDLMTEFYRRKELFEDLSDIQGVLV